ncbi:hypothetical protein FGRA07_09000 [Fusarium graminearum]|nr:hypothetical protein FGRA07_09000 [Fusarium graminearum]
MTKRRNPPPCGPGLCHLPEKISQKTGRVGVGYYYSPSMYFASWKLKPIPGHRTPNIGPAGKDFAEIGGAGVGCSLETGLLSLRLGLRTGRKDICVGAGREYLTMDRRGVCYTAVNRWGVEKISQKCGGYLGLATSPRRFRRNAARWSGLFRTRVGYYHLDSLELGPLYREEFAER